MFVSSFKPSIIESGVQSLSHIWSHLRFVVKAIGAARTLSTDLEFGRKLTPSALQDLGLSKEQFSSVLR